MKNLKTSFKYIIKRYNATQKIFKKYTFRILILKLAQFQCKIQYTKTEENLMERERRKREKIDNLRVPQANQEMCAPSTNTRATTLSRGHIVKRGMNEKKI